MYGLASRIFAVVLAGMMAVTAGVCPCAKAECAMAPRSQPKAKACCHKTATPSEKPVDGSHSGTHHRCANCVAAATASQPGVSGHAIAMGFMPAMLPPAVLPVIEPANVGAMLVVAEGVPIPPLLRDLFHSSCLLTV